MTSIRFNNTKLLIDSGLICPECYGTTLAYEPEYRLYTSSKSDVPVNCGFYRNCLSCSLDYRAEHSASITNFLQLNGYAATIRGTTLEDVSNILGIEGIELPPDTDKHSLVWALLVFLRCLVEKDKIARRIKIEG